MRLESGFRIAPNWSKIGKMTMTSQLYDMTSSSNFFDVFLCLLLSLVTVPSFMSISSLVLELWQFYFIRGWPEIRKWNTPSEYCPISGDWGKLGIPSLVLVSLIKCYWMLQNTRVTAFTVSELLRENQQGGVKLPPPPTQNRVKDNFYFLTLSKIFVSTPLTPKARGLVLHD